MVSSQRDVHGGILTRCTNHLTTPLSPHSRTRPRDTPTPSLGVMTRSGGEGTLPLAAGENLPAAEDRKNTGLICCSAPRKRQTSSWSEGGGTAAGEQPHQVQGGRGTAPQGERAGVAELDVNPASGWRKDEAESGSAVAGGEVHAPSGERTPPAESLGEGGRVEGDAELPERSAGRFGEPGHQKGEKKQLV